MPKAKKQTQIAQTSTNAEPQEPFLDAAQRLGEALAAVYTHPNCPDDVVDAISEFDCCIFNHCNGVEISLRYSFAHRLAGMLNKRK